MTEAVPNPNFCVTGSGVRRRVEEAKELLAETVVGAVACSSIWVINSAALLGSTPENKREDEPGDGGEKAKAGKQANHFAL